jgi:TPR repeat protein
MKLFIVLGMTLALFGADIKKLQEQAKQGDVGAIFQLAYSYENGLGVQKDEKKAFKLYQKAASMGDEDAIIALSLFELETTSKAKQKISNKIHIKTESNFFQLEAQELEELIKKAKENDKEALFLLATLYENGCTSIASDEKKAVTLYKKAAKLGSQKAQKALERLQKK